MRRYLVVANQTLISAELRAAVRERLGTPPCRFHVVVPATPPREQHFWTEGAALVLARERLEDALAGRRTDLPVCHVVAHVTALEESR